MSLILLKPLDPKLEVLYKIRPPVRVKKLIHNPKELHAQLRRIKILEYAARQEQRTALEKENDYQELTEEQQEWVHRRMHGSARSWKRCV